MALSRKTIEGLAKILIAFESTALSRGLAEISGAIVVCRNVFSTALPPPQEDDCDNPPFNRKKPQSEAPFLPLAS
jgi:hypothetical protein